VNLLDLQRRMAEDVMRPLTADFEMQPSTCDGRSTHELAEGYIKPNERLSSFERLEIYNRQYWFRVIGAVAEDFPALSALVGEKKFDRLSILSSPLTAVSFCWMWHGSSGLMSKPSMRRTFQL
jgi:hypothetical protein